MVSAALFLFLCHPSHATDVSWIAGDVEDRLPQSSVYRGKLRRLCKLVEEKGRALPPELESIRGNLEKQCGLLRRDDAAGGGADGLGSLGKGFAAPNKWVLGLGGLFLLSTLLSSRGIELREVFEGLLSGQGFGGGTGNTKPGKPLDWAMLRAQAEETRRARLKRFGQAPAVYDNNGVSIVGDEDEGPLNGSAGAGKPKEN